MDKIDVPRCHVAHTRWWPPFCAAAVLATEIMQEPDFITSHTTGQRQATSASPTTG